MIILVEICMRDQPEKHMTTIRLGHNGGPPLEEDPGRSWRLWCWKRAHKKAWASPPREIVLRRMARAKLLGMSYHDYTLEILERGRQP
jgi:hypothetical protein